MSAPNITLRASGAVWWSTLEILARYGVQFGVMLLLARLLAPADFGLMAMLLVFTSISALLVDSGFSSALVQRQSTTANDETTVFLFTTGLSLLGGAALWFLAPAVAAFYSQPALIPLTHVILLTLPLGAIASVPDAVLTIHLNFKARAKAEIISSLCSGGFAIFLALRDYGVYSLAWQAVLAIGLRAVLLCVYSGWLPRGRFSRQSFRSLFGFGGYILASSLLEVISVRLQSLLIGRLYEPRTLGFYTLAQNTQQAPTSFVGGILNRVGLPVFSSVAREPAKLLGALRLSLRIAMFFFLPCMLVIALAARPLLTILYGSRWAPAAPILSILTLASAFWPLHVLNLAALSAQGRSDLFFRLAIIKKAVMILLICISSAWGPDSIALSVLVSSLFGVAANTWYSRKLLGYGLTAQFLDLRSTLILVMVAALSGWLLVRFIGHGAVETLLASLVGAVVYIAGALAFRNTALAEVIALIRVLVIHRSVREKS